jgi:hypothetical protein
MTFANFPEMQAAVTNQKDLQADGPEIFYLLITEK